MLRLKIRSHTQKRYAVLRTTEHTFRKDVYLYWNFGLLIYSPQKTTPVKRPLGAFYSSKRPVSNLEYSDFCIQNSLIKQPFKF